MSFLFPQFFNVANALEFSLQEFDNQWALVDNFWTRFSENTRGNGDKWISCVCRLSKPRPSAGRKDNIPAEKRRTTWKRPALDCQAKIKVTWFAGMQRVRVEKFEDALDHCHSIDEVDMRKRSTFIRDVVTQEASKSYRAPAITNITRGRWRKSIKVLVLSI